MLQHHKLEKYLIYLTIVVNGESRFFHYYLDYIMLF